MAALKRVEADAQTERARAAAAEEKGLSALARVEQGCSEQNVRFLELVASLGAAKSRIRELETARNFEQQSFEQQNSGDFGRAASGSNVAAALEAAKAADKRLGETLEAASGVAVAVSSQFEAVRVSSSTTDAVGTPAAPARPVSTLAA